MENKTRQVLMHLKRYKDGITTWEAISLYRATRLSAIIFMLKKRGHNILARRMQGNGTWYVRYYLIPPQNKA